MKNYLFINSGTHYDKSVPWLAVNNPAKFMWLYERSGGRVPAHLVRDVQDVRLKARNIRLHSKFEQSELHYHFSVATGKLAAITLAQKGEHAPTPDDNWTVSEHFSFLVSGQFGNVDKTSGAILRQAFKQYVLDEPDVYLSKKRIDNFFSESKNFYMKTKLHFEKPIAEYTDLYS